MMGRRTGNGTALCLAAWLRMFGALMLGAALAACTGPDATLGLGDDSTQSQTEPATTSTLPPPPEGGSNVYFAPIVGAPVEKVTPLSRQLSAAADAANVQLAPENAANLTHEIRGYFSALAEGNSTTVIHVWDVFTPDGQRVHRIQAQEVVSGVEEDPWAAIPDETMAGIADSVLASYRDWLDTTNAATAPAPTGADGDQS